jgi:hypothetical protein
LRPIIDEGAVNNAIAHICEIAEKSAQHSPADNRIAVHLDTTLIKIQQLEHLLE